MHLSITYFEFLVDMIDGRDYICLLKELNKVHFYPLNHLDKNRVYEVRDELRGMVPSAPKTDYITIFELLVWLAHLYEDRAKKYGEPDHTATWFWCFIVNCNLNNYDDLYFKENKEEALLKIHEWCSKFNNRTYGRDGTGSPFPLKNTNRDVRKMELFYQLNAYFIENN